MEVRGGQKVSSYDHEVFVNAGDSEKWQPRQCREQLEMAVVSLMPGTVINLVIDLFGNASEGCMMGQNKIKNKTWGPYRRLVWILDHIPPSATTYRKKWISTDTSQ